MSKERECGMMLRRIAGQSGYDTYACTVTAVDGATCTIERILDDKEIKNVRLNATIKTSDGLVIVPKIGSVVLVTNIDGDKYFVSQFSEIEKITLNVADKVSIKNPSYSLADAFKELISAIGNLTVTTGVGPSGIPINAIEFEQIQQKLNNLLE